MTEVKDVKKVLSIDLFFGVGSIPSLASGGISAGLSHLVNRCGHTFMRASEISGAQMALVGTVQHILAQVLHAIVGVAFLTKRGTQSNSLIPGVLLGTTLSGLLIGAASLIAGKVQGTSAPIKPVGVALLMVSSLVMTVVKHVIASKLDKDHSNILKAELPKPLFPKNTPPLN